MAELIKRLLTKDFQRNLYPQNAFYKNSKLDAVGSGVKTVEIGVAGSIPETVIDPAIFPLTTTERVDLRQTYDLREIVTKPNLVRWSNEMITNYDKRQELIIDHKNVIQRDVARNILQDWAPSTTTHVTTGTATRTASASSAATGTRKKMVKADFLKMKTVMDLADIPDDFNRYVLLPPELYEDLLIVDEFVSFDYNTKPQAIEKGILGMILGFNVMMRSSSVVYSAGTKQAIGAAGNTTDSLSAIFWHSSFVRHAETPAKLFLHQDVPQYTGDIMNVSVLSGGTTSYIDGRGVYAMYQGS